MLRNYLKIAFRNLWKQRIFSTINVLGLAVGMACCFLIVQYVQHERSYDQFHANLDRLYRINYQAIFAGDITLARIPPAFAPQAALEFPEFESMARMYPRNVSLTVTETDRQFEVEGMYCADSTITKVFQFEYLHGDDRALYQPYSVILTDKMAKTLFGTTNVLGKGLRLADNGNFKVTGVIKDWPENAHMELKLIIPYQNMADLEPAHAREITNKVVAGNMTASHSYTYVLLKEQQSVAAINKKFKPFILKHGPEHLRAKQDFHLFPVKDIHLQSEASLEQKPPVDSKMLYLFIGIGLITLLIACINFINLTTASSLNRVKEVGVRKVLGAGQSSLIGQFLGESLLLSFFAFLLSLPIAALALPKLNSLTNLDLSFAPWANIPLLLAFIGIFIIAGLLAGSYPAFFVSRFKTINSLKGSAGRTGKAGGVGLRKGLITLQFLATIVFISGALITYLQLDFLRNQSLGFDKELTLMVPIDSDNNINAAFRPGDATIRQRMNTVDDLLMTHPNINAVTQCDRAPGFGAISHPVHNEHVLQSDAYTTHVNSVDYDYAETFGLEVVAGREFDKSFGTDHLNGFVLNEQAVRELGWENPEAAIGQKMTAGGRDGQVLGVLKDYYFENLRVAIDGLVLRVNPGDFRNFAIQVENKNLPETLTFIEDKWKEFFPAKVFEYTFLDESLNDIYRSEEDLSSIMQYFAFFAMLISCFGLFGLAALLTRHRFKEIGIRKVLGASVTQILTLLAADFVKLILIAMILAFPFIWYFSDQWMQDFEYHISFPWWVPIATGLGVIVLAFATISSQTIKAATSNPVDAIHQE